MRQDPDMGHDVVVLAFDGVEPFDLASACEVFTSGPVADHYSLRIASPGGRSVRTSHGYLIDPADRGAPPGAGGTVIVPGFSGEASGHGLALLRRAHRDGARVASICIGAFALAAAGLLDGRPATTHWLFSDKLAADFPKVHVQPDVLFVDDGDILTSAGAAAGIDLCLHMVRADLGAAVANEVARRMVVAPHREGGQAQYVKRPVPAVGGRLEGTRTWALEHLAQPIAVSAMARHAHLTSRHFSRLFIAETGTTPHRWLISQRVLHARHLLETTSASVEEVAAASGFRTAAALRVHFRRALRTSPGAYRRSFRGGSRADVFTPVPAGQAPAGLG
jgi:AraC family transcriptional activator FtrA